MEGGKSDADEKESADDCRHKGRHADPKQPLSQLDQCRVRLRFELFEFLGKILVQFRQRTVTWRHIAGALNHDRVCETWLLRAWVRRPRRGRRCRQLRSWYPVP